MLKFTFEIEGEKQFDRAFSRVSDRVQDLRPVWDYVETGFYRLTREQFTTQGSAGRHGKWQKLSRKYAEWKQKNYPGMPILQRTGRMMQALTRKTGDTVVIREKQAFGIGASLDYPMFHQTGTSKMPRRRIVDWSDSQRRDMQKMIQRGLLSILRKDSEIKGIEITG
jgi:phage gpG-like protein